MTRRVRRKARAWGRPLGVGLALALVGAAAWTVSGCEIIGGSGEPLIQFSTDFEKDVGAQVSQDLEAEYPVLEDAQVQDRLDEIGDRLVDVQERDDITYTFKALDTDDVNALAAPAGYVYVTRGLLEVIEDDDDELAGVMGHEVGHVTGRHAMNQLAKGMAVQLGIDILAPGQEDVQLAADAVMTMLHLSYSRQDEYDADRRGLAYAHGAGYDGEGLIRFLEYLVQLEEGSGAQAPPGILSTHPPTQDRVDRLKAQLGTLEG